MSGGAYFDRCIGSYVQALHQMGECQFDQAKAALNEAIRWDQVYWQEADMPVGHHITEECSIAAKVALEAIKVAEMYQEVKELVYQKKITEAKGKIAVLLAFHRQTNFVASMESLNCCLNQNRVVLQMWISNRSKHKQSTGYEDSYPLQEHYHQNSTEPVDYSQYPKNTANFYARIAKRLLARISDSDQIPG